MITASKAGHLACLHGEAAGLIDTPHMRHEVAGLIDTPHMRHEVEKNEVLYFLRK